MNRELRDGRIKPFTCSHSLRLTLGQEGQLTFVYILTGTGEQQDVEGVGRQVLHPEMLNCILKSTIILENTERTLGAVGAHGCSLL